MNSASRAASFFLSEKDIANISVFGSGNINDTYMVTLRSGEERILQRLNPAVFPDPVLVMRNMHRVTEHLRRTRDRYGPPPGQFRIIQLFPGKTGDFYKAKDGAVWRLMSRIKDSRTIQVIDRPRQAGELGRTLGVFHRLGSTLDPSTLADTLPGFHQTPAYLQLYDRVKAAAGTSNNGPQTEYCHAFIGKRRAMTTILEDARPRLRHQVIHGDPKVANFLFNPDGDRVISLIDLDTVKPGLLLHDIGDALRSCCNPAGETAQRPDSAFFDPRMLLSWLREYFAEAGFLLTHEDKTRIVAAILLMSFEVGLRFFTDHLNGNPYFKIRFQGQNLQRAMAQFHLARSIERQRVALESIVTEATAASIN